MGGGKGGSDFDPKGKSDSEIRRFCNAFMVELYRHIGKDTDVPGTSCLIFGISFLIDALFLSSLQPVTLVPVPAKLVISSALTRSSGMSSLVCSPERASTGAVLSSVLRPLAMVSSTTSNTYVLLSVGSHLKLIFSSLPQMIARSCPEYSLTLPTTLVAISGSGNVAQYTALKVIELGATVVSLSDSRGSLIAEKGYTAEFVNEIAQLKLKGGSLESLAGTSGYTHHAGKRPWTLLPKVHIALPGATQNEVSKEEAEALVAAGVRIVAEGSNMGCTEEAVHVFEENRKKTAKGVWYAPGKASNCGGVAVSGLEMAQNSQRLAWSTDEVDAKLKSIMTECFNICYGAGSKWSGEELTDGHQPSLLAGANVAGFIKVADAMREQGDWW